MTQVVHAQYERMLGRVFREGHDHVDRTGKGRRTVFGFQERFDVSDGSVPIPTSRRAPYKGAIEEMIWIISGSTSEKDLRERGCQFWSQWGVKEADIDKFIDKYMTAVIEGQGHPDESRRMIKGAMMDKYLDSIGPMYGFNWRNAPRKMEDGELCPNPFWPQVPLDELPSDKLNLYQVEYDELVAADVKVPPFEEYASNRYYRTCDQFNEVLRNLRARPFSARHVVNAWIPQYVPFEDLDVAENVLLGRGSLSVCHAMFQFNVTPPKEEGGKNRLSLLMYQRSVDTAIGAVSNITQYAVLLHLVAHCLDMDPMDFIYTTGDTHLYLNHLEGVEEQLKRETHPAPKIWINPAKKDIFQITSADIEIQGYQHSGELKYEVAR